MTANLMSEKQIDFVRAMLAEVFGEDAADDMYEAREAAGTFATRDSIRNAIDALIARRDTMRAERRTARPARPARPAAPVTVPAGYYAVDFDGVLRFYRVVVKTEGRWAGRTFLNRYKSDDELRVSRTESDTVLAVIAADIDAAAMRFVAELTRCRMCGRMLTDLDTAKVNGGYGPECVKKV